MSGAISSVLYAQSDAGTSTYGNAPHRRELLIPVMELSQNDESAARVAALELRVMNMAALVRGLLAEVLDLQAVSSTLSRENDELDRQELRRGAVVWSPVSAEPLSSSLPTAVSPDGSTLIRPRGTRQPDLPVAPAAPEMVRIMQSDGTMKMEPRYGEARHIDSSGGYGRNRKDKPGSSNQSPLMYAAEEEKPDRAKM